MPLELLQSQVYSDIYERWRTTEDIVNTSPRLNVVDENAWHVVCASPSLRNPFLARCVN